MSSAEDVPGFLRWMAGTTSATEADAIAAVRKVNADPEIVDALYNYALDRRLCNTTDSLLVIEALGWMASEIGYDALYDLALVEPDAEASCQQTLADLEVSLFAIDNLVPMTPYTESLLRDVALRHGVARSREEAWLKIVVWTPYEERAKVVQEIPEPDREAVKHKLDVNCEVQQLGCY